jgi:AmmeMemoRadiSam system protein B/AmmeMemoRadiSam system protein A
MTVRLERAVMLLCIAAACGCASSGKQAGATKEAPMVRQPAVAGQFYPADAGVLTSMVDSMLGAAEAHPLTGRVVGIQVPHAGYPFSGPTAAHAFKLLAGMDDVTVVAFGTSHRMPIRRAAVYPSGSWHTPLGDVEVDSSLARAILAQDSFFADLPAAHAQEHSIEVEVPFLQRALGRFKIVPIMVLQPTFDECERAGRAVAQACAGRNVVLLASTDLYHGESYTEAKRADSLTVSRFLSFDPRALYDALAAGKAQACGGYGVVTIMAAARGLGADRAVLLAQTNSNDVMNERSGYVVGYSAVAFTAPEKTEAEAGGQDADSLTEAEQQSLVAIARNTLESYIRTGKVPPATPLTARLEEKRGAFVTLTEHGDLRGCIGYIEPIKPLFQAVSDMAVAASTEDPRFPPVGKEELGDIHVEITVLSPVRPLASPDSVVVGKHGLIIRKGRWSGLLLPQVPVEQGWNREQFLQHTCLKAGLPPSAWKDKDAQLSCFTGQVFGEKRSEH